MIQEAATGIPICLQNASLVLQPYHLNLKQMLQEAKSRSQIALGNVTACDNEYKAVKALSSCLNVVGYEVLVGRDILMAGILGEMADFKANIPKLTADFTVCTNNVQDKAINESVNIIQASRECIRAKVDSTD
ncbi:hypothetical protein L798_03002 [Zootermopsis nevadensis]|uniref:Uncharacterized protein n=2 Tax=Zootermopsis nevadensis TaxID=136037 RepID=A0A067QTW4_ZOONE|nr:hypothetical protein L798_03002 [Zootermopsis nevadensis]